MKRQILRCKSLSYFQRSNACTFFFNPFSSKGYCDILGDKCVYEKPSKDNKYSAGSRVHFRVCFY